MKDKKRHTGNLTFAPEQRMRRAWLLVCGVALFAWYPAAARQRDAAERVADRGAGVNFAIADFDGDSLPDFATVQAGLAMASRTTYRIRFDLSLGKHGSWFSVTAPNGGLQIASRDVNGDNFLDLIISTRIANEPVAVLLNDGRGNFRFADAGAFGPGDWDADVEWCAGAVLWRDEGAAIVGAGWAAAICDGPREELLPASGSVLLAAQKTHHFVLPHEDRGRAPPAA